MKLWKKVYLFTLAITVICVNAGILGLFRITYRQMLNAEKKHCEAEFALLQQSLSANVAEMEQYVSLSEEYFEKFLSSYSSYYEEEIHLIGLYQERIIFGESDPEIASGSQMDWQKNGVQIISDKNTAIYVMNSLDAEHDSYRIVMRKDLKDFDETWNILWPLYLIGSIMLSIGISLLLGITVRYLMKPVDALGNAVKEVSSGDLSKRVVIRGKNEIADLGMQFNYMAEALEKNMKLLEAEAEKKQQLIDNLAHEMNTPITSIQGFARFLQIGNVKEEEQQECLGFILGEAKRLRDISSTLLEMARLNHNEIPMKTFSLKELSNRIESLMEQNCSNQNVVLSMKCESGDFYGNEVLMESLLRNLILNSLHAVQENGRIMVEISNTQRDQMAFLSVIVRDDGCGIPKEALPFIFDPFYRVDKSRSRAVGGSGLGLPFCRKIVQLHDGRIYVQSEVSLGTTMIVELPIKK